MKRKQFAKGSARYIFTYMKAVNGESWSNFIAPFNPATNEIIWIMYGKVSAIQEHNKTWFTCSIQ